MAAFKFFNGALTMKTMQKVIAVLLACVFMTGAFAATAPAAAAQANQANDATAMPATTPAAPTHKHHKMTCCHSQSCMKKHAGMKMCMKHHKKAAPAAATTAPAATN